MKHILSNKTLVGKRVCRSEPFCHFHTKLSCSPDPNLPRQQGLVRADYETAMKCLVNGTNGLFPEDDNSIV